ncbi:hypothetical protein FACS1894195_0480 [Bacteroidia bacterium]|nr:hypothetical protein FACS1894195_0480 [Bacteroidia bacterium]
MELREFLEKFVPDYEEKEREALIVEKEAYDLCNVPFENDEKQASLMRFSKYVFPEALKNFAEKICDSQKRICKLNHKIANNDSRNRHNEFYYLPILNAIHPNIDEL